MGGKSLAIVGETNSLFGAGLCKLLNDFKHFSEIHLARSHSDILYKLGKHSSSGLLVVGPTMLEIRNPDIIHKLRIDYPLIQLVLMSDSLARSDMLLALSAGVHGYIPTSLSFDHTVEAFREILLGKIYVPKEIADVYQAPKQAELANSPVMTQRENEVIKLVAQGNSNKMIAHLLHLSEGTVKAHVHAVYRKLGVNNRVSAAAAIEKVLQVT